MADTADGRRRLLTHGAEADPRPPRPHRTAPPRSAPGRAGPDRAGPGRTGPGRAEMRRLQQRVQDLESELGRIQAEN
ncbi:hypothetical protein ABZT00_12050, partial [Streptomyces sp. NPDC005486]